MARPLVSIVMATFERDVLLFRSLWAYEHQDFDTSLMELVVVDDHSTDETQDILKQWSKETGIPVQIVVPCPKNREWRDCGAVLNHGIRASRGKYVIMTHPEVIPGKASIAQIVEALRVGEYAYKYGVYACAKVYYLTRRNQDAIDDVNWREFGNLELRKLPGFYSEDGQSDVWSDYSHACTDLVGMPGFRVQQWESWVFGGMTRDALNKMGGMLETQEWGSIDVGFVARRRELEIPTVTVTIPESIVVHQNHDGAGNVPTPRNQDVWIQELKGITFSKERLIYPAVDNL